MSTLFFLVTILPLIYFLFRLLPLLKRTYVFISYSVFVLCAIILSFRTHLDDYSGLDNAAYGTMADAFLEGDPPVRQDTLASSVPSDLLSSFMYRPLSAQNGFVLRPTRNLAFQLEGVCDSNGSGILESIDVVKSKPFYLPTFSLAEAGSRLGRCFTPIIASFWVAILFAVALKTTGIRGVFVPFLSFLATAYPIWFFRGEYPEVIAVVLSTSAFLSHIARPFSSRVGLVVAGLSVIFASSFHFTALLVSVPVLLFILVGQKLLSQKLWLVVGAFVGFLPAYLITRFVTAPYGDWTRLDSFKWMVFSTPEHTALFAGVIALAIVGVVVLFISHKLRVRLFFETIDRWLNPFGYVVLMALPCMLAYFVPSTFSKCFRLALPVFVNSVGIPGVIFFAVGIVLVFTDREKRREHFFMLMLSWALLLFMIILGQESIANRGRVVMPWGLRRFIMPIIALISIIFIQYARRLATIKQKKWLIATTFTLSILAVLPLVLYHPTYSITCNNGLNHSDKATQKIERFIKEQGNPITIFDYFRHSTPFSSKSSANVLGIGNHATTNWGNIAEWVGNICSTQKVLIVSSYNAHPAFEENFSLNEVKRFDFTNNTAKGFPKIALQQNKILNIFMEAQPIPESRCLVQELSFSGSPIGLRGDWFSRKDDGAWSRQSSGFVAPLPSKSGSVDFFFDYSWFPPSPEVATQSVMITYGENEPPIVLEASEGRKVFFVTISSTNDLPSVGVYRIESKTPYDPMVYGIKGYPDDLGLYFHKISAVKSRSKMFLPNQ